MRSLLSSLVLTGWLLTGCTAVPVEKPMPAVDAQGATNQAPGVATTVHPASIAYPPATPSVTRFSRHPTPTGEAERAVLARLEREFAVMDALIGEAETVADRDARPRFRYDHLRRDLEMVRHGIRLHLQDPGFQPRRFEALRGDYR